MSLSPEGLDRMEARSGRAQLILRLTKAIAKMETRQAAGRVAAQIQRELGEDDPEVEGLLETLATQAETASVRIKGSADPRPRRP